MEACNETGYHMTTAGPPHVVLLIIPIGIHTGHTCHANGLLGVLPVQFISMCLSSQPYLLLLLQDECAEEEHGKVMPGKIIRLVVYLNSLM